MKKIAYFLLIALSLGFVACEDKNGANGAKITYKATQKLPEAQTEWEDGLYLAGFGAKCTSHVYDETTQTGTLVFATKPRTMDFAFYGCKDLISVDIPKTITIIGTNAFKNSGLKEFSFPDWITEIYPNAFAGTQIESIIIPETITKMGTSVFEGCKQLTEVYFSNELDTLPQSTLRNCSALKTVVLHDNLSMIDAYAFFGCSDLPSIVIPRVIKIDTHAFDGCSSLATVTCKTPVPPTIDQSTTFTGIPSNAKLYVPSVGVTTYKTTGNWIKYFKAENISAIAE